jgi:hypothetical protein
MPSPLRFLVFLAVVLTAAVTSLGCAEKGAPPNAPDESVANAVAVGYAGATAVLVKISDLEAERFASIPKATPEELAQYEARVQRLERAKVALDLARAYLSGERKDVDLRQNLRDAATLLKQVVDELTAAGVKMPSVITQNLPLVEVLL